MTDQTNEPTPAAADLQTQVTDLQQVNDAALQALAGRGHFIDQALMLAVRVDELQNRLGELDRTQFELRVQRRYAEMIETVETEIRKAQLMQGVAGTVMPPSGHRRG